MKNIDTHIGKIIRRAIEEMVFPGCVVGVVRKSGERIILPYGNFTYDADSSMVKNDSVYDAASVTKSIPGSSALLLLIDKGKLNLDDRLVDYVPAFGNNKQKKDVKIKDVLTYTLDLDVPSMASLKNESPEEILKIIINAPLKENSGKKFVYTNSTSLFIHIIVEKVTGETLDVFAEKQFFTPLAMNKTTFYPATLNQEEIAPTEVDDWRGGIVRGVVHDESAYTLRRKFIVGLAGLFSTVPDMLNFQEMLLNDGEANGRRYFSPMMVKQMHSNQLMEIGESTGLGWKYNVPNFMGEHSAEIFGMTGFTGCAVLNNFVKGVGLVILSNRTWPKRPTDGTKINAVRRDIADIVFSLL